MIETFIRFDLNKGMKIQYQDLEGYINKASQVLSIGLDSDTFNKLLSDMEYQFKVKHTAGCKIYDDYDDPHNWYVSDEIKDRYFWRRYKKYLIDSTSIDIRSINLLEDETLPNLMNCLGNPNEKFEGCRLKRGLIIGDVQSGKTATYSGLICMAADAGYKVVILLAGTTESLRQQTQERIDEAVVGRTTKKLNKILKTSRVGVGQDNKEIRATSFTSCAN